MSEEEQEALADRYYMADAWFAKQGRLAGWLWTQDRAAEAEAITEAMKSALNQWTHPFQVDLFNAFIYAKFIAERAVGWRSEEMAPF